MAFGATGIGLTRTEHMFFEGNRIDAMREMILADNVEARKAALAKLLPYQKAGYRVPVARLAAKQAAPEEEAPLRRGKLSEPLTEFTQAGQPGRFLLLWGHL